MQIFNMWLDNHMMHMFMLTLVFLVSNALGDQSLFDKMKCTSTYNCNEIWISSSGYNLSAWMYIPTDAEASNPYPAIVMANGYSLLKEQYMGIPAATFYEEVQAVVILFDFRKIGLSSGEPRSEVIPSEQLDDYVNVITFARNQSYIKPNNIGIWGISMSGGHVLNLGTWWGYYLGIQAVVAVVPSIRVMYTADLLFTAGGVNGFFRPLMGTARQDLYDSGGNFYASYSDEWGVNMSTQYFPTVSENCAEDLNCFFTVPPSYEWFVNASVYKPDSCGNATCQWMNMTTFRSVEACLQYFPMANGPITEVATLQLVASNDPFFPLDQQQWANAQIQSPVKKLKIFQGAGHYDLYPAWDNPVASSTGATSEAVDWFQKYLIEIYDYGEPMSVWPSSAGNCGTGTYFSTSSWNCQADSTDRNLGLEIASLFFMIVGLLLIITIIIVIVVYKTSKNGKRYIVNTIKRIFVLHDGHGIDSTSTSPPFHNNM